MNNSVLYSDIVNFGFTQPVKKCYDAPYFYGSQQQFYNEENTIHNNTKEAIWNNDISPNPKQSVTPSNSPENEQFKVRQGKQCRSRTLYSCSQLIELEKQYAMMPFITGPEKQQLAASLNITPNQVKIWFQNRRMKDKKMAKKSVGCNPNGFSNRTSKSNISLYSPEGKRSCELPSPSNESIQSHYSGADISPSWRVGVYENTNITMQQPQTFNPFMNNQVPSSEDQTFCYSKNGLRNGTSKSNVFLHSPEGTSCELPSPSNESVQSHYSGDEISPSWRVGVYESTNIEMQQPHAFNPSVYIQTPSSEDQTLSYTSSVPNFNQNRFNQTQKLQKDDRFEIQSQESPQNMVNTAQNKSHPELQRYQAYCQRINGQGTSNVSSQLFSDSVQSPESQNYVGVPQYGFVMTSLSTEPKFVVANTATPLNYVKTQGNRASCQFQPDIPVQTPPNTSTESARYFRDDHFKRGQAVDDINLSSLLKGAVQSQGVEQGNCGRSLPNERGRSELITNKVSYTRSCVYPQNSQGLGRHQETPKNPDDFIHSSGGPLGPIMNVEAVQRQENHAEHLMETKRFLGDYMPRDSNFGEEFLQEMSQEFFFLRKEVS